MDGDDEVREPTTYRFGQHFQCKGCSVLFGNPGAFNYDVVQQTQERNSE